MKSIREVGEAPLVWATNFWGRRHELRAGDEVVARLRMVGFLPRRAIAETAEGQWTLARLGWLFSGAEIRSGQGLRVARFDRGWILSGAVELERGPRLHWRLLRILPAQWGFLDDDGDVLIRFRSDFRPFRGRVTIEPRARTLESLSALVLLGWFLALAARRRG